MKSFIFNDERIINSYGFRVLNSGGSFERFDSNPVMLDSHQNTLEHTIGRWQARRIEGPLLMAAANFDTSRERVKEIEGQVDRSFIKGCSMGLNISFDKDAWQIGADGVPNLVKWELMEVSICAVPSNSNSLALFNSNTGKLIPENEFKLNLNALTGAGKPFSMPGATLTVNSLDDFERLSLKQQLQFKEGSPAAYQQLFASDKIQHKPVDQNLFTQYDYKSITDVDKFEKLTLAQQMHFLEHHEVAYMALFGLNRFGLPDNKYF